MLTASTSPKDVVEAYRLGANSFFVKPSSVEELIELFKSVKACWLRFNEFPEP
jgi:DNA-binding response OmpR family regulator